MNVRTNHEMKSLIALAALGTVMDPELNLSVADLGLIYGLEFDDEAKRIVCEMTFTTRFCPMGESMKDDVRAALEASFAGYEIQMLITFDPQWDHSRISEEGRQQLSI